jgi:hypothetical protein
VIAVSFTAAGCATSTPALPASDTPAAAHGFLTGENGRADLEKISSYAWEDHGSAAAALATRAGRLAPDGAGN